MLKIGNNLITSGGAIALISSINDTEHCEMEELDLTVSYSLLAMILVFFLLKKQVQLGKSKAAFHLQIDSLSY